MLASNVIVIVDVNVDVCMCCICKDAAIKGYFSSCLYLRFEYHVLLACLTLFITEETK